MDFSMKMHGFTLPETLIVLIIAALIFSFAVPWSRDLLKSLEAQRVTTELYSLVLKARSEAALQRTAINLCGSSDARSCDGKWDVGIIMFRDNNHNNLIDSAEDLISYAPLNITPSRISWRGFGGSQVTFEQTGASYASNGTFTYCREEKDPRYSRQIILNRGGRARTSRDDDKDGKHEGSNGLPIVCP